MNNDEKFSLLLDCVLIGVVAFFLYLAYQAYYNDVDEQIYNVTQRLYVAKLNSTTWEHSYNFTSEVFSVKSDINVTAIARLTDEYRQKRPDAVKPKQLFISFPDAMSGDLVFEKGHVLQEKIVLLDNDGDGNYTGPTITINYQAEGDKCVILSVLDISETMTPTQCQDDQSKPVIRISSADSYYQLQTNRTANAFAWVFVAFAVISSKGFIQGFFRKIWLFLTEFFKKNKNQTNNKEQTKTN